MTFFTGLGLHGGWGGGFFGTVALTALTLGTDGRLDEQPMARPP